MQHVDRFVCDNNSPGFSKTTHPDGSFQYVNSQTGEPIQVYRKTLPEIFETFFSRFETLLHLLPESDYERFGVLFEALIESSRGQVNEAIPVLENSIGRIALYAISHQQPNQKPDKIIDAELIKK